MHDNDNMRLGTYHAIYNVSFNRGEKTMRQENFGARFDGYATQREKEIDQMVIDELVKGRAKRSNLDMSASKDKMTTTDVIMMGVLGIVAIVTILLPKVPKAPEEIRRPGDKIAWPWNPNPNK
jgi:hypothetical protein